MKNLANAMFVCFQVVYMAPQLLQDQDQEVCLETLNLEYGCRHRRALASARVQTVLLAHERCAKSKTRDPCQQEEKFFRIYARL